ncbi:MAG: hypothetical protein PWQ59_422 [Thermoanaerobacterium sp.]|nr:hypothetical protein [Thermoanaerobacterium sp.]
MLDKIERKLLEIYKITIKTALNIFSSLKAFNTNRLKKQESYVSSSNFSSNVHSHNFLKKGETSNSTKNLRGKNLGDFSLKEHTHEEYTKDNLNRKTNENEMNRVTAQQISKKEHIHNQYVSKSKTIFPRANKLFNGDYYSVRKMTSPKYHTHSEFVEYSQKAKYAKALHNVEYTNNNGIVEANFKDIGIEDISKRAHKHDDIYITKGTCDEVFMPKKFSIDTASGYMNVEKYRVKIYRYKPLNRKTMKSVDTFPIDFMSTRQFERDYLVQPEGSVFRYMDANVFAGGVDRNTITNFMKTSNGDLNDGLELSITDLYNKPFIPGNENTSGMMNSMLWDTDKKVDGSSYNDIMGSSPSTKFLIGFFNNAVFKKLSEEGPKTLVEYDLEGSYMEVPVYDNFYLALNDTETNPDLGEVKLNPQEAYVYPFANNNTYSKVFYNVEDEKEATLLKWLGDLPVESNIGHWDNFSEFGGISLGQETNESMVPIEPVFIFGSSAHPNQIVLEDTAEGILPMAKVLDVDYMNNFVGEALAVRKGEDGEIYNFGYSEVLKKLQFDPESFPLFDFQTSYFNYENKNWQDVMNLTYVYTGVADGFYKPIKYTENGVEIIDDLYEVTYGKFILLNLDLTTLTVVRGYQVEKVGDTQIRLKNAFDFSTGDQITFIIQEPDGHFGYWESTVEECTDGNNSAGICVNAEGYPEEENFLCIHKINGQIKQYTLFDNSSNAVFELKNVPTDLNTYRLYIDGQKKNLNGKNVILPLNFKNTEAHDIALVKPLSDVYFFKTSGISDNVEEPTAGGQIGQEFNYFKSKINAPAITFKAMDRRQYYWYYSVPSQSEYTETSNVLEAVSQTVATLADNFLQKISDVLIMALLFLDYFLCWAFNWIVSTIDNILISVVAPFYTFLFRILIQIRIWIIFVGWITITLVDWKWFPFMGLLRPVIASVIHRKPFVPIARFISSNPIGHNIVIFSKEYTTKFDYKWRRIYGLQKIYKSPYTVLNKVKIEKKDAVDFISNAANYSFTESDKVASAHKYWVYKIPVAQFYKSSKITNPANSVKTIQGKRIIDHKYLGFNVTSGQETTIGNYGEPFTIISFEELEND